ncbi:abortive infection system toxin AbiGii family protein [Peribacillus butanolivorans]|uniref:abortive infection system toxin AbiGii family protein n=1 Tax=Peribacillus butanolivorans TaxID=421767 RepID=UPI0036DEB116
MKKMFKKGDSINQEGNENVAFLNSKVTYVVSAFDEIAKLGSRGDYEGAFKLISQMTNLANIQHPYYPHYTYKAVNFGDKTFVEHEPRSREDAQLFPLSYRGRFKIPKGNMEGFTNIDDLIHDAYIKQKEIEIDMVSLYSLIKGEKVPTPFLDDVIKDSKWVIKPEPLPDSLKLKLSAITGNQEFSIIDYLEMSVSDFNKEENFITINNSRQQYSKLLVSLMIPLMDIEKDNAKLSNAKINIRIKDKYQGSIEANKNFLNFMMLSEKNDITITFKNLVNQKNFLIAHDFNFDDGDFTNLESDYEFLERLARIESHFDIIFTIPEKITEEDWESVQILESVISQEPIKHKVKKLTLNLSDKQGIKNIIENFDQNGNKGKSLRVETSVEDPRIELFDASVPLEKLQTVYSSLMVENINKLKRKCEDMEEGEVIKVNLVPGTSNEVEQHYFARFE